VRQVKQFEELDRGLSQPRPLAVELLHLPHKAAGVGCFVTPVVLAPNLLHLPHKAGGVPASAQDPAWRKASEDKASFLGFRRASRNW